MSVTLPRMTATLLDGEALAARLRREMTAEVAGLRARGIAPKMVTVLVGDDPASATYIGRKHADCAEVGIEAIDLRLPSDTTTEALLERIAAVNADPAIYGQMVQLPLPPDIDETKVMTAVSPAKDIDGLHPQNLGLLLAGKPGLLPCTPAAILALLQGNAVPLAGRRVAIIGRGQLVGRPLAMLLSARGTDATVTLLHSGSRDIAEDVRRADIVIAALGQPGFVTADMVKPGAAVVGVGISYGTDGSMISDVAADVADVAGWVTPPQGSVGALTRAMLLRNLLQIAAA
ncbi:bifunctional 5,10-methylenetetrahydrofolate dehydrogenase/5,10-methenyltetrahydrofolate cyclohydrolase [Neorhizobium sp. DAR64860/K0K1]|uniref:bifunctional 5,10-methylenetetrahydrofolate dehydrogenase/5,10-methenyltetrahydrofolate cyclohydrolase n=1 Tax=Neorhizobium sp. DAR64860/K0K1 TaxID=3421955 RepID=UPI003D2C6411